MPAASRRNRSIDSRVVNPRGWADTSARRRPRCKRRDLGEWRWRSFSWPDGWPSSAWQSNMHKRSFPNPHRHSHRRPSIHQLHTLCLNRPRPPFHQDCQAPFRDHLGWSRLRVVHRARWLTLIGGRLPRRRTSAVAKMHESRDRPRPHRRKWSRGSHTADSEGLWTARRFTVESNGWGVCGAFKSANRCNAEWTPRSHRCGCIVR